MKGLETEAIDSPNFDRQIKNITRMNPKGSAAEKMILNRFLATPMFQDFNFKGQEWIDQAHEWLQTVKSDLQKKYPEADLSDLEELAHKMYEDYLARIGQLEEGNAPPKVLFNPKPMQKGPDEYEYTEYVPRGKEDKEAWAIKRTVDKQKLPNKKPKELNTGFYKNYLGNRPVREEEIDEASKAEVRAELDQAIKDFLAKGGEIEKLKPNKVRVRPGTSLGSKHIGTPGEFGRKPQARFLAGKGRQINPGKPVVNVEEGDVVSLRDEQKLLSKLVKDWWHGDENEHAKATLMFAKMGYEPYEDGDEIVLAKGDDEVRFQMDDIIEGYSAGAVGGAGQSYRKFVPKVAGTKESAIMKGIQAESKDE